MKINEIIREKRLAKGLTQAQMAASLGVSASAVNKWEKSISYPDITSLPALARLLGTDLNTLLSFQEDLSREEIGRFLSELSDVVIEQGVDEAFHFAAQKIQEFPSCDHLVLNAALTLEGLLSLYAEPGLSGDHAKTIEALYAQAARSGDPQIRDQARAMLISTYMRRNEFDRAEALLSELPDQTMFDKQRLRANLSIARGRWDEAALLLEGKLLSDVGGVHTALLTLMEIARKENRISDAERIAHVAGAVWDLFDLWDGGAYLADFQLAVARKDVAACVAVLERLLPAIKEPWFPSGSPLYRHIPEKKQTGLIGESMLLQLLREFEDPDRHEYDFLREDAGARRFIEHMRTCL